VRDVEFRDLNAYVKKVVGSAFTSKYSCAWVGPLIAAVRLAELGPVIGVQAPSRTCSAAVDAAAARLENTHGIACFCTSALG
jgi:regulator of RNase E activity RraA